MTVIALQTRDAHPILGYCRVFAGSTCVNMHLSGVLVQCWPTVYIDQTLASCRCFISDCLVCNYHS